MAADGQVAGRAESFLVIFRFEATLELGRSQRTTTRPLQRPRRSYGVDGANTLIESRIDFTGKDVGAFIDRQRCAPPAEECS
jgi:hypothetical protein